MGHTVSKSGLLTSEIARSISEKIQSQQYKAGEHLTVRKLCEEYDASETPVKQALNQLAATGLVVSIPKCGMQVRTFSFQDMKENLEARLMIELYSAAPAVEAAKRDEAYVSEIRGILIESNEQYRYCVEHYTMANFNRLHFLDHELHREIVQCCKNSQILEMYEGLKSHASMFLGFNYHSPETLEEVIEQHTEIVNELVLCDVKALRRALESHLRSTIAIYRNAWVGSDSKTAGEKLVRS